MPSFHVRRSVWHGPLMNAASCHLLMELPCLRLHCCDTGSVEAKRLLKKIKRQNKLQSETDRQTDGQITH